MQTGKTKNGDEIAWGAGTVNCSPGITGMLNVGVGHWIQVKGTWYRWEGTMSRFTEFVHNAISDFTSDEILELYAKDLQQWGCQ